MLAGALAFGACDHGSPTEPPEVSDLPARFLMTGDASGSDSAGLTATCTLALHFELTEIERSSSSVEYTGTHGGEIHRRVLAADGSGFEFFIDVFGEVEARLVFPRRVEIRIPVNETAEGRFYRELARFEGTVDELGHGAGAWVCAPLDVDTGGYLDTSAIGTGTWSSAPE